MFGRAKKRRREHAEGIHQALADGRLCGGRVSLFGVCTQTTKHQGPCIDNSEWTANYIEYGSRT